MSLTAYRTLGRSGLVVSPLALGTMTFGQGDWGADDATSLTSPMIRRMVFGGNDVMGWTG